MIARQWASLRWAWLASRRTTLRSVSTGTRLVTPSSVAFCITRSMRSPRETPWASVSDSGDSRSTARSSPTATVTMLAVKASMRAAYSPPVPLKSVSASPTRSRSTRVTWLAAVPVSFTLVPLASGASTNTRLRRTRG